MIEYLKEVFWPYMQMLLPLLFEGFKVTIYVSIIAFILAVILGVALAVIQLLDNKIINKVIGVCVAYCRATPLLIQLFIFYYGLPMIFEFMKSIPKVPALIVVLAINSAAYISEIIRGAIDSVDSGQYEASVAFGMSMSEAMGRIILPQAAVAAVPSIVNTCLDIVKLSSLGMTIGIQDVMGQAQLQAAISYRSLETYLVAAVFYWILMIIVGYIQRIVEKRFNAAYQR